ncbi:hypothetical protein [Streptomyces sp. NPDC056061]|uniref:hypothetical protein n=1 Tax=Streptomyces sp. NPDC056061 TaxID=3345700 RepID=UPI0035D9DD3A
MVDVGVRQLRRSRDRLERRGEAAQAEGDPQTAGLMLFYSAECGLKAEILAMNGSRDTSQLPGHLRNHDLRALAKELRLSAPTQTGLTPCRRKAVRGGTGHGTGQPAPVDPPSLHQAWRYGADLNPEDEARALRALRTLIAGSRTGVE